MPGNEDKRRLGIPGRIGPPYIPDSASQSRPWQEIQRDKPVVASSPICSHTYTPTIPTTITPHSGATPAAVHRKPCREEARCDDLPLSYRGNSGVRSIARRRNHVLGSPTRRGEDDCYAILVGHHDSTRSPQRLLRTGLSTARQGPLIRPIPRGCGVRKQGFCVRW